MQLEKEIAWAVKHIVAIDTKTTKSQDDLNLISQRVLSDVKDGSYDFPRAEHLIFNQNGKRRLVKQFHREYRVPKTF